MTKQELITALSPDLLQKGYGAADVKSVLETYTVPELEKMFRKRQTQDPEHDPIRQVIRAEARRQVENDPESIRRQQEHERKMQEMLRTYALAQIFRTQILIEGIPHVAVQNAASENIIINWLHPGETLTPAWFRKVFQENPGLANQLQWREVLDPQTKQLRLQQDRDMFSNHVCRQFQIADTEANFKLVCELVGSGLSKKLNNFDSGAFHLLQQAADSGALAPASNEEMEIWRVEAAEKRQDFLVNRATPDQLKAAARDESAIRQQAQQAEAEQQQLDAAKKRDGAMGYPPLPEKWQGRPLDAAFIKTCPAGTQKLLQKRFGSSQLTARLRGVA